MLCLGPWHAMTTSQARNKDAVRRPMVHLESAAVSVSRFVLRKRRFPANYPVRRTSILESNMCSLSVTFCAGPSTIMHAPSGTDKPSGSFAMSWCSIPIPEVLEVPAKAKIVCAVRESQLRDCTCRVRSFFNTALNCRGSDRSFTMWDT